MTKGYKVFNKEENKMKKYIDILEDIKQTQEAIKEVEIY